MKANPIKYLIVFTIFFSCNNGDKAEVKDKVSLKTEEGISYPTKATNKKEFQYEADTLFSTLNNYDFIIYPNGKIDQFEHNHIKATYKLQTENTVEAAYLCFYKDNLIVYYTDTDFDSGASFVESINTKTLKRKWKTNIPGFNLGQPANKENISYVSSIGFVGKLNLNNGQYFWKYDDLYDRETYSFNSFYSIVFVNENTIFISLNSTDKSKDSIIVNDKIGHMVIRK